MTTTRSFRESRFSPRKYPYEIQDKLDYLDMLDGPEDKEEILEIVNQYPDLPESQLALANLYAEMKNPLKFYSILENTLASHPHHMEAKATLAQAKYFDFTDEKHKAGFAELFAPEIECIVNDKALPNRHSDVELRVLLLTLNKYFIATKQIENYHKIFGIADSIQDKDLLEIIAFNIKGIDMPIPRIDVGLQLDIEIWATNLFVHLADHDIRSRPFYDLFYILLNKPADEITDEDIAEISILDDVMKIRHDIIWLMAEGVTRTNNLMGECNLDYFVNAIFVASHHNIAELNKPFLAFLSGIPPIIHMGTFGDIGYEIIGPPLQKLGMSDLDGFFEMLTHKEEEEEEENFADYYDQGEPESFWYVKALVMDILGAIATLDHPRQEEAKSLIRTLWNHYSDHDHEMLGWTMHTIAQFEITGFEKDIKEAYSNYRIDLGIHGTFEDYFGSDIHRNTNGIHRPFAHYATIDEYYQHLRMAMERFAKPKKMEVEEQINHVIEKFHKKNRALNKLMRMNDLELDHDSDLEMDDDSDLEMDDIDDFENDDQSHVTPLETFKRSEAKIGRNDPCPCGSGKKYKKCCLNKAE